MHDTYPIAPHTDPTLAHKQDALPVVNPMDQLRYNGTLQVLNIAPGGRVGGETDVSLVTMSPIQTKEAGFIVGDLPADLLAVVQAGTQNIGIIDTKREAGTNPEYNYDDHRFILANITITAGNQDGYTFAVAQKPDGSPAATFLRKPDAESRFGQSEKRRTPLFDSLNLSFDKDPLLSQNHGMFYFTNEGTLHIADTNSLTGTSVMLRPAASPEAVNSDNTTLKSIGKAALPDTMPKPFRLSEMYNAAREVLDDEITRDTNNGGEPLDPEYRHNQTEARASLVDSFVTRSLYRSKESFVEALHRAHVKAAANDVYNKVGGSELGLKQHEHGVFRGEAERVSRRTGPAMRVAQIAKRYNDPYGSRFDNLDSATFVPTISRVKLEGIADEFQPRDVVYGNDTDEVSGYEFSYPSGNAIDSYMGKMQELGSAFAQEVSKTSPDKDKALGLIARQYQYGAAIRPYPQINNSLFMNLANMQIKMLGLRGITHQEMDHVAQRMQPENFVAYFKNRVNGSER